MSGHPLRPDSSIRKSEPIAERIDEQQVQTTPRLFADTWALFCDPRRVFFGDDLRHIRLDVVRVELDGRTLTGVAIVFGQMNSARAQGYLHVERPFGAVLPIDFEAKEVNVEFLGFGFVKNPERALKNKLVFSFNPLLQE